MFDNIISKIIENKEWIFSGIGVLAISAIFGLGKLINKNKSKVTKQIFKQLNKNNSQGTQIGIQVNKTGEKNDNEEEGER